MVCELYQICYQQGLVQYSEDNNCWELSLCLSLKEPGGTCIECSACLERHRQTLIFFCKEEAAEICTLTSLFSFSLIFC